MFIGLRITFSDPLRMALQTQIYFIKVSLFLYPVPYENKFSTLSPIKTKHHAMRGVVWVLRRGGDSNPRYPFEYASLANWWIKPLSHLSNRIMYYKIEFQICLRTRFAVLLFL